MSPGATSYCELLYKDGAAAYSDFRAGDGATDGDEGGRRCRLNMTKTTTPMIARAASITPTIKPIRASWESAGDDSNNSSEVGSAVDASDVDEVDVEVDVELDSTDEVDCNGEINSAADVDVIVEVVVGGED